MLTADRTKQLGHQNGLGLIVYLTVQGPMTSMHAVVYKNHNVTDFV